MGKSSYPSYAGGNVSINGQQKASSYMNGNTVHTNYNMSDAEKQIYDYSQNSFLSSLPKINVFDSQTQQGFNDQLTAYTNKGKKIIDQTYTPMLESLKTDIARRFGNFDNSSFMDSLNDIEDKRADSYASLAQNVMSQRDSLINNELSNRYEYLNFLNDIYNNMNDTAMNYMNAASANSKAGNSYNAQAYQAKLKQQQAYTKLISDLAFVAGDLIVPGSGTAAKIATQTAGKNL